MSFSARTILVQASSTEGSGVVTPRPARPAGVRRARSAAPRSHGSAPPSARGSSSSCTWSSDSLRWRRRWRISRSCRAAPARATARAHLGEQVVALLLGQVTVAHDPVEQRRRRPRGRTCRPRPVVDEVGVDRTAAGAVLGVLDLGQLRQPEVAPSPTHRARRSSCCWPSSPASPWESFGRLHVGADVLPGQITGACRSPSSACRRHRADVGRKVLDLATDVSAMTPAELMKAILQAPVDLLWNGGIGTYVKSSDETHADAGDKANDAIRIDGRDLRARCVGEGGNLGLTQLGRIEYAVRRGRRGGAINTDFIDNSAGVDTSDHEVNIKILLDRVVARRRPHREAAQPPARRDDRRGRRAGAARQLRAEPRPGQRRAPTRRRCCTCTRTGCGPSSGTGVLNRELEGLPTSRERTPTGRARRGAHHAGAVGAAGLDQDRARRQADRLRPARRPVPATST